VHAGKLRQVTNFRPTIVGGTAKHCIDQYMVLFCYCSPGGNTAMPGGLHDRLRHAFQVAVNVRPCDPFATNKFDGVSRIKPH